MRVGFVSQYYPPEPGAAAHPGVVATALSRRGHDVRVLTGFPSYPEGVIYDGYVQRPRMNDRVDGVALTRVPYFLSHDASGSRRALSMLSFGASSALQSRVLRGSDVVLAYASPATTANHRSHSLRHVDPGSVARHGAGERDAGRESWSS